MSLKEDFEAAQARVKGLTSRPSNEDLLGLYGLFKQATAGDVSGSKPSRLNFKARAKYEAWEARKGLGSDAAMTQYIALVDKLAG